jgi:hypothetical protein
VLFEVTCHAVVDRDNTRVGGSVSLAPHLVVGTQRLAKLHSRLAMQDWETLPARMVRLEFETPESVETLQWHRCRDHDPGSLSLRERVVQFAKRLPAPASLASLCGRQGSGPRASRSAAMRLHALPVHEGLVTHHLDEDLPEAAVPHVALHTLCGQRQRRLGAVSPGEDFGQERGVHGRAGRKVKAMRSEPGPGAQQPLRDAAGAVVLAKGSVVHAVLRIGRELYIHPVVCAMRRAGYLGGRVRR